MINSTRQPSLKRFSEDQNLGSTLDSGHWLILDTTLDLSWPVFHLESKGLDEMISRFLHVQKCYDRSYNENMSKKSHPGTGTQGRWVGMQ